MTVSLRDLEAESIRAFVQAAADRGLFTTEKGKPGRVLDLGCGRMPYRSIVEATGAAYEGWDRAANPGSVVSEDVGDGSWWQGKRPRYDAILTTQTWQYLPTLELARMLRDARYALRHAGSLVATGPTFWPVVEAADLWRFTPRGAEALLTEAGFREVEVTERAHVEFEGERWSLGWGACARA